MDAWSLFDWELNGVRLIREGGASVWFWQDE